MTDNTESLRRHTAAGRIDRMFEHPDLNTTPAPQPPLTDEERRLIARATNYPWNRDLRDMLAMKVKRRGGVVGNHDTCGDLVDQLESIAR